MLIQTAWSSWPVDPVGQLLSVYTPAIGTVNAQTGLTIPATLIMVGSGPKEIDGDKEAFWRGTSGHKNIRGDEASRDS